MFSSKAELIIKTLNENGFEAYAVGGSVRDILLGAEPHDFDITTSARPSETKKVFSDLHTIDTGIAHGTVTVMVDREPFELTTFRCDGEYKDSRHPESVTFTSRVEDDLSRRDFTINSMAMGADGKVIDPFGGKIDLENRIIRCTGNADTRFKEDALRIMRALRFSSVLGFEIEKDTADAIHKNKNLLLGISVERIFVELKKLLCGKDAARVLMDFSDVICTVIPELEPSVGFEQKNKYHIYDVYEHSVIALSSIEPDSTLRLTMLLHDMGKPYVFTEDEDGFRHFTGHPDVSAEMADRVLQRLHSDTATKAAVCLLCKWHDKDIIPDEKHVKRLFMRLSYEEIIMLCKVRIADNRAQNPVYNDRETEAAEIMRLAEKINSENQCVSLRNLAIDGHDMIDLGYKGLEIGKVLKNILEKVIDGDLPNEREALIEFAVKRERKQSK